MHVGITTDSGSGLHIPVVRFVAHKSLGEVAAELEELRKKSLTGDLRARDLTGARLSVSVAGYKDLSCSVPFAQQPRREVRRERRWARHAEPPPCRGS